MKKLLLVFAVIISCIAAQAQYPEVSIMDIKAKSQTDLGNCDDLSPLDGDTVTVVGVMLHDGNLTDVASGSVTNGHRSQVFIRDISDNGASGEFKTILVQGVYDGNKPVTALNDYFAGDIIRVTGIVNNFRGQTQLDVLSESSVTGAGTMATPTASTIDLGLLNNNNSENQLETGERYEGDYVRFENLTVTQVTLFSGDTRVSMEMADENGNKITVYDIFLAQKLPSWETKNPSSPAQFGSFTPPSVGTIYESIAGIIQHDENGCTGGSGAGYRLNPFNPEDYVEGAAPPAITNLMHAPGIPTSSDNVMVTANISDADGTVASANVFVSVDGGAPTQVAMTPVGGSEDFEAAIGSFADGSVVSYYVVATDNANNETRSPIDPEVKYFHVKDNGIGIFEIQQTLFNGQEASAYVGETVTVTGIATATTKQNDLGYVYIQDENYSRFAGIQLTKNPDLAGINPGDVVTVTGIVSEIGFGNSSVTAIEASSVSVNGTGSITPVVLDPSTDNTDLEEYEGMLVTLAAPNSMPLYMANPDIGFGEYGVASVQNATANQQFRVLAGRQSGFAQSSLYVSYITDEYFATNDGDLQVTPVLTSAVSTIESITGIIYDSFGTLKITPRNNDDVVNATVGISENAALQLNIFPNPANNNVNITLAENGQLEIISMNGSVVATAALVSGTNNIELNNLTSGVYFGRVIADNGNVASFKLIKK